MELTVLTVPDCPNAAVLDERLAAALVDHSPLPVVHRIIDDEEQAARFGMHGSPTLLVDGVDPFTEPDVPTSVSCRLYRDAGGRAEGVPSVTALRLALQGRGGSGRS